MKTTVQTVRILVGLLFIISGIIKANDPLGLSYKMQEFFEVWSSDLSLSSFFFKMPLIQFFDFLHQHSLPLSVVMITLEVMTGVALLIGWQAKAIVRLLLLLIIFFTFLTGYAYASGKFKNCGCFGDCIPITPVTSFLKDLLLTAFIIFLVTQQRHIRSFFQTTARRVLLGICLLLTIGLQWYVLNYLPIVDCLPFKKGAVIAEQMKIPANAINDSFAIRFIYKKGGKEYAFSPLNLPPDLGTYQFVSRKDELIRKGNAEPAIKGFALTGSTETDSTSVVLTQPACIVLFCENFDRPLTSWMAGFKKVVALADAKKIPVYVVGTSIPKTQQVLAGNGIHNLPVFSCDYTAVRTAARTAPCLYFLKNGVVMNKYSFRQLEAAAQAVKTL